MALTHSPVPGDALPQAPFALLADTDEYFTALGQYRNGDPTPLARSLADAAFIAIHNGRELVTDLHQIRAGGDER